MDVLKTMTELLKLPIKIILALCIASGLILFLPDKLTETLYMLSFREKYGFVIGLIFIVTLSITMCYIIFFIAPKIWKKLTYKKKIEKIKNGHQKFLSNLTKAELKIIIELIKKPDNTLDLPINRGIVQKLESFGVISKAGSTFAVDLCDPIIPYFLQPWVFEYFDKDGKLIERTK